VVVAIPAALTPLHFQMKTRRCRSRLPTRLSTSEPVAGAS